MGTIVIKCVEFASKYDIPYGSLLAEQKPAFVFESQRLSPTVTTIHRIVERDEKVDVLGVALTLQPSDEVCYPFVCINRDPTKFSDPEEFRLNRPSIELKRVLSWSAGPHVCPAKDLSIQLTILMLDQLATRYDLRRLHIPNPEF